MGKKIYVLSLGGSLIVPSAGIDWKFLRKFRGLILKEIKKGNRFVIITGGGSTARSYQKAANRVVKFTRDDSDWLGIHATRLNAHLIKTIFRNVAHPRVNKNPRTKEDLTKHFKNDESVLVAAGWRPGWSTDYVAVILAERFSSKTIINLSNIDMAYDKDPDKHKDAAPIKEISWPAFRRIVGDKWDPGLSAPFDPVASKQAERSGLKVIILNGRKIDNLKKCLDGKRFLGTTIN
ncbi:MAG: UMP kinase [Candidatus Falkowbacteria bacterium]